MPNRKRRIFLPFLLLTTILIITATSCNMFNEPEGGNGGSLTLTVEDASCTEAWIKLNETNAELPASVKLYANDTLKQTLELTSADTLIYDEGLLPNRAYAYRAELIKPQKPTVKSKTVTATTLDTTSHNFTWETFTFGGANGSSVLYDVAIINENDIWAVGEIHTEDDFDSLGHYQPYNAVHWNGQEWELRRVYYKGSFWTIHSIFAFSKDDVWFDAFVHWDGENYCSLDIPEILMGWSINAIWGTSSSDFYVVGNNGNIAHYDGSGWEKIESGTEMDLVDIRGDYNELTDGYDIFAVANNNEDCEILQIKGSSVIKHISGNPPEGRVFWHGVWFDAPFEYYIAGHDIWKTQNIDNVSQWKLNYEVPSWRSVGIIEGEQKNNLWAVGSYGEIMKFNGVSWQSYRDILNLSHGFSAVAVKDNLTVGLTGSYTAKVVVIHTTK